MIEIDFKPPDHQLRQFGFISLVGFPLVGVVLTMWPKPFGDLPIEVLYVGIGIGVLMGVFAVANQTALIRPVYVGMMIIAFPIGMVLATVLLALIYYGLFTPVAVFFRLTGRDKLERKLEPQAASYWKVRETQRTPASYLRLY